MVCRVANQVVLQETVSKAEENIVNLSEGVHGPNKLCKPKAVFVIFVSLDL